MEQKNDVKKELREIKNAVEKFIAIGKNGLLKSEELYQAKYENEDRILKIKEAFSELDKKRIEKFTGGQRLPPRPGLYMHDSEVVARLLPLRDLVDELLNIDETSGVGMVEIPESDTANETWILALGNAKTLLKEHGAPSAIDRMHTALFSLLRQICDDAKIRYSKEDTLQKLFVILNKSHTAFSASENPEVAVILKNIPHTLEKINSLRNERSLAHANFVLQQAEAELVINYMNTLMRYVLSKTQSPQ